MGGGGGGADVPFPLGIRPLADPKVPSLNYFEIYIFDD